MNASASVENETEAANRIGSSAWLGLLLATLTLWALTHYTDKWKREEIEQYEQAIKNGEHPVYTVMGIPTTWTPYDE